MRRIAAVVLSAALLAGCSNGSLTPAQKLQDLTAVLVDEANAKDLPGLRNAAADLRQEIEDQVQAGTLTRARGELLLRLLAKIEQDAVLVNGEPEPTEEPSETPSSTPSPTEPPVVETQTPKPHKTKPFPLGDPTASAGVDQPT